MLRKFDREDLNKLWSLVKETFSTIDPIEDKEKMLWVELKRIYELDPRDQLCALQKYMHDPLEWKIYDTCGVHHVSTGRGHEIFMLVEKDYPLIKGLTMVMLFQDDEMFGSILSRRYGLGLILYRAPCAIKGVLRKNTVDDFGKGVIICLYVDDMLIFGTDQNQVDKTKKFLSSRFSMKDMGEANVILDCSPVSTPIDSVEKLMPDTGKPVDQLEYSRAISYLMYAMTSTRPDIAYVVGRLSMFTSNPSRQHWHAITRVFKYLKGTMNYGLSNVGYPSVLEAYSNASWINHVEDSSSTSGWVFLLGGCAISWASVDPNP
ncbi:zinc finger, CCHC-type containing protein [Tanacetum coccineum]